MTVTYAPTSKIVADLHAVAENQRLKRDGGFVPTISKPHVWAYDPQTGSTFERQRVDSRYRNAPTVPRTTALRHKGHKQYMSAEVAKTQIPTMVMSYSEGEVPLPGPGQHLGMAGTFGAHNASARLRDGSRVKFATTSRWADDARQRRDALTPGIGQYRPHKTMTGEYL
jgi:hypothetical protein